MNRTLLVLLIVTLMPAGLLATTITGDITTNTTLNAAGSPYVLNPAGNGGGTITVRNGATLTIDTTDGAVALQWNEDCDLKIGNGSTEQGTLEIKAASGALTFQIKTGGNIRVANNGRMYWSNTTAATTFTRYNSLNTWGALIFEASQTRQSDVKNATFSYGGNDSKAAMILVEDNETYPPYLENLTFSNQATSGVAAVRMNGKGINTLKEGNIVAPFTASSVDYVFYLNAVTSTEGTIRFPDPDSPDSPTNYLAGTCTVGDSSNVSHWRFDDAYTFKCAASSKVEVVNGSIWGTEESRTTFRSVSSTPGFTDWSGLEDDTTTKKNTFGGVGPFAFLTVRDASLGVYMSKGSGTLYEGETFKIPGIEAFHCSTGVWLLTPDAVVVLHSATVGGTTSTDWCSSTGVFAASPETQVLRCHLKGVDTSGRTLWTGNGHTILRESRITGPGYYGVYVYGLGQRSDATIDRSVIETSTTNGVYVLANQWSEVDGASRLRMSHSFVRATNTTGDAIVIAGDATSPIDALIEDCTIMGPDYGLYGNSIKAGASAHSLTSAFVARRTNFASCNYGAYFVSTANNTEEYNFEECYFSGNTYGIYDARTQTARAVAYHCDFVGNTSYAAYDASGGSASTDLLAEFCYWNSASGPAIGPGTDDVNSNVDWGSPDDFLPRQYLGVLIGGSPAGPADLGVANATGATTLPDQLHIVDDDSIAISWTFASDFEGQTQGAYEIDIDDDPAFGSLLYNGSKTSSSSSDIGLTPTLAGGTVYYVRVKLWNYEDVAGPWYLHAFRTNAVPGTVGNTNRTPATSASLTDWTPVFVWERPADTNEDPLHFEVFVDWSDKINESNYKSYTAKSWDTGTASGATPTSLDVRDHFELSTDGGSTWIPIPSEGAPSGDTVQVRLTWPDEWGIPDTSVLQQGSWKVRAYDMFEYGSYATTWTFNMGRSYTISGQLQDNTGAGLNSKTMRLYVNGVDSGDTDDTQTVSSVDGRFDIVTTDALEVGDVLWVYVDGETEKGAAVFHFTGDSMTWAGESIVVRAERAYVYGTVDGLVFSNADFEITTADTDIPWTYSSGTVTFKSTLDGTGDGLHLQGQLDMSGALDGTTSLDVELNVGSSGLLRTQGFNASFHKLENNGILEVLDGSTLTLDGSNSTTTGTFVLDGSTLKFAGSSALSLKVAKGTFDSRNSATIQDLTANVSDLLVDSTTAEAPAVLSCADTTFDEVSVTVEADGVLALFNDNIFQNDVSTQHVYWKSESSLSATQMRGVQFNTSVNGTSTFNVTATSTANNINMLGCGGVGQGEAFDSDSNNKVDWELTPPTGLRLTLGDTRIRADWDANDQVDASAYGFNLYKAPFDDSAWTANATYAGGYTTFTDSGASFTSALAGLTFYPDATSTTTLTVYDVPSSTTIRVSGDYSGLYLSGDPYSFFVKVNGSLLTDTHDEAESLTNGTTYYFYLTIDDSTEDAPLSRNRGEARTLAPAASSISAVSPDSADATSVLALSVIGDDTHWESSTTVTITQGGGSGVTVNDTLIISAKLVLVDATLSSATTGTWTMTVTEEDIWGIAAYDEVETELLTVSANDADLADRPTLVFSTNNGGVAADADTSGSFVFNIDFTDQGGGVDTTKVQIYASRDVTISSANKTAGTELIGAGLSIDTLNDSRATCTINQTAGTELFADGEYTLTARVADDNGSYSEWATRRFYVEGAASDVAKTGELLHQGDTELTFMITGTFSTTVDGVDFGSGITTVSYNKDSGTEITVTVTVAESAACGPRTFTVDMTTGTDPVGVIIVEYPTNILPTVNNDEPSRNPAIGGVNVFLVNGEFFKSETDLAVRGRMMGISWSRFYRSQITYDGPLGHGWVGHYFQRAVIDSGTSDIWWYTPDGRKEVFPDVTGGYSSPVGVYVTASSESTHDTITLTDRHGYQCVFNSDGRLWRCIDRNGNTTECSYNYAGQLTTITNDLGETFTIAYQNTGRVDTVSDNMWNDGTTGHTAARQVEYEYDSEGNLVEQKAPTTSRYDGSPYARTTYGYAYDSAHNLTRCINPREFAESSEPVAYLENFYDSSDRVIDQKLGDEADVLDSHITKSAFIRLRYESSTLIHEIDRNGHRTDYTIDGTGRATTVSRYTGFYSVDTDEPIVHSTVSTVLTKLRGGDPTSFDTEFTYNSNHEILSITYPRDNKVTYEYPSGSSQTSGTCTSDPTDTVLADTGKSWTPDAYIGMILRVGSNAGEYAYYPIVDNDATTITIESSGFSMALDGWTSGEDYAVYDEASDPMAAGNVLSVTRSDEALGSESDIVTSYTYEPRYQFVKTVTDPRGNTTSYSYDYEESAGNGADAGNLVLVTSPTITGSMASSAAITTRTTYNEYGQPVTMVDGVGNFTHLKYYTSGSHNGFLYQRISAWGELDLTSEFEYDPVGNLTASWSPRAFESGATKDDYKTSYEVNELNQTWHVTSKYEVGSPVSSSLVSVDAYKYFDANGNLTHSYQEYITDSGTSPSVPGDLVTPGTFSKASSAMAATWVETTYEYGLLNYQTKVTRDQTAGSAVYRVTSETRYDSNYNVIESISPLGNRSHTVYDERDMVYQRIAGAESDVAGTFQTDYDANGNVISSFDALGNETEYTYDGFDRATQVADAGGNYRTSAYDANSNVTTSSAYDVFGTLLAQSTTTYDQINRAHISARLAKDHNGNPIGDGWNTSTTLFDKNSRVVSSTNDNGVTYTSFYDGANRTTETRDAVGNRTLYTYNANGATTQVDYIEINGLNGASEPSHVSYILNRSDVAWEVRDRRWSTSFDTSGNTTRDSWGRVTVSTDAAGNTVSTNYDLLSRVTDSTEEAGTDDIHTMFEYDDDGRTLTRAIKRNPGDTTYQETEYVYDERSRLITLRRPDGDIWNFRYDVNGNRIGWDDPLGTTVMDTYDARNLIAYRNIVRGTGIVGTDYESYEFDGLGRLQSCSNYADGELLTASAWEYNTQSQPERFHQTIADKDGAPLGTWTSGAEYDATGFNTATIYSDGHRVEHLKDQLDRTLASYDVTENVHVAAYVYAGPHRLVERTAGNGVRTTYEWEASGCGCGGATPFCESVQHTRVSSGEILFGSGRLYDELGLVTVEREDHLGALGSVYRYDEAKRLDTSYFGVDLYSTALTTYADQSNTPSTFGLKRAYNLDPRGNRSGSTGVADSDDSSGSVYDYSYTANSDTNQYTAVDGDSYTFDAIEQTTYDPSTGLYHAWDYKGQLIKTDKDSALTSPERTYSYDNQGKRRRMTESYNPDVYDICYISPCACNCGCTGNEDGVGELITHEAATAAILDHQLNIWGPEVESPGSSSAVHPATAAVPSSGRGPGNAIVATFGTSDTHGDYWRYMAHNQHGSTSGCTDENGAIADIYTYTDYGHTVRYKPVLDCPDSIVSSVANDTPSAGQTTITLSGLLLTADAYNGLELRVVRPEAASNRLLYGEVLDTTSSTIVVQDDGSDSIYNALNGATQGFQVLDLPAAEASPSSTSGTWDLGAGYDPIAGTTSYTDFSAFSAAYIGMQLFPETDTYPNVSFTIIDVPNSSTVVVEGDTSAYGASAGDPYTIAERCWRYDSGNDESDYFDADASFAAFMVGWTFVPDISKPCYLPVIAVDAENKSITVKGDASGLAAPLTDRYHLIPPAGVARSTGAYAKPEDAGDSTWNGTGSYDDPGAKWLWSGYLYVAPQVGHEVSGTTYGAQSGTNHLGQYHCWNRELDLQTGRWTTPDPLAEPSTNLQDYSNQMPLNHRDPKGTWIIPLVGLGAAAAAAILLGGCSKTGEKPPTPQTDSDITLATKCGAFKFRNTNVNVAESGGDTTAHYGFIVEFTPDSRCCKCKDVTMFQMVRTFNDSVGVVRKANRTNDAEGWHIDENSKDGSWIYAGKKTDSNLGRTTDTAGGGSAALGDNPSTNYVGYQEFVTCAICRSTGEFYGCIKFKIAYRNVDGWIVPSLETKPFDRKADAAWLKNDTTYKAWNDAKDGANDIPEPKDCCK